MKVEYQKITNLFGAMLDEVPRFITKKSVEVYYQSGSAENRYKPSKQTKFKTSMLRSGVVIPARHILLLKEILLLRRITIEGLLT